METIEIDTDVFTYLQKHARPFVDTPNSTLRRLFGIDVSTSQVKKKSLPLLDADLEELLAKNPTSTDKRTKAPKANLELLIQKGFIQNGQKLYLIDYQGNRIQNASASITGVDLIYNDQRYSMSNLAQELLIKMGFKSESVRGPAHWITDKGNSIKDLWQQYLDSQLKK